MKKTSRQEGYSRRDFANRFITITLSIALTVALGGCRSNSANDIAQPAMVEMAEIAGCYHSGDYVGYNHAYITLTPSGHYWIITDGDLGEWGRVEGRWYMQGNKISLASTTLEKQRMVVAPASLFVYLDSKGIYLTLYPNQKKRYGRYKFGWEWNVFSSRVCPANNLPPSKPESTKPLM
ncbi:MAG: hypothetical protein HRT35_23355 [Algicola sp.]|nr:hypothetical protein [Algicola sp.]